MLDQILRFWILECDTHALQFGAHLFRGSDTPDNREDGASLLSVPSIVDYSPLGQEEPDRVAVVILDRLAVIRNE